MSKRWMKFLLAWVICVCAVSQAFGNNVLAPNLDFRITPPPIGDFGAFSFLGEVGPKNLRGSATYGVYFTPCQRFKATGEFLTQDLKYHFVTHNRTKWTSQYAVGGAYQYLISKSAFQSVDLGGSYSHAFHKSINSRNSIAGSDGADGYFGSTIRIWPCAFLSAAANYDYVKYHRHCQAPRLANGWGGSLKLLQLLPKDLSFSLASEFRKPYDFYKATLDWNHQFRTWDVSCGLYGSYTDGKKGVPNVTAAGVQLNIAFGSNNKKCCRASKAATPAEPATPSTSSTPAKPAAPAKAPSWNQTCYAREFCNLVNWVSTPAVYEPVVLAIADDCDSPEVCPAPTSSTIPNIIREDGATVDIATAPYFHSNLPLTFSATGLPTGLTINSTTGVISGTLPGGFGGALITVTATSSCGSTSQSFHIIIPS